LCSRFHIFNRHVLEEYVFQVEGGPHLLQLCFCVAHDSLLLIAKKMYPSFESLAITSTPSLHAYLMNIHHDRSILEDDSISLAFKAHIHSCSSKGAWLWLIAKSSIHSFLAHFIFTLVLHLYLETSIFSHVNVDMV
jgi:hypothetical protein